MSPEGLCPPVRSEERSWVVSVESVCFGQERLQTLAQLVFIWYIFSHTYNLRIFQAILSLPVVSEAQYFPSWRHHFKSYGLCFNLEKSLRELHQFVTGHFLIDEKRYIKMHQTVKPFIKEQNCFLCCYNLWCKLQKGRKEPRNYHCIWTGEHVNLNFWPSHFLAAGPCPL